MAVCVCKQALISVTLNIEQRCRGTLQRQFSSLTPVVIKSVECCLRRECFKLLSELMPSTCVKLTCSCSCDAQSAFSVSISRSRSLRNSSWRASSNSCTYVTNHDVSMQVVTHTRQTQFLVFDTMGYRPTRVVPHKRPLNGCVCVCVWYNGLLYFSAKTFILNQTSV